MRSEYSIIVSTFPNKELTKKTAKILVEQRLAACVQSFPIESVYLWKDEVYDENEIMLFIKSRTELFEEIATVIRELHPYEVPEIIQLPITGGLPEYLAWISGTTRKSTYEI